MNVKQQYYNAVLKKGGNPTAFFLELENVSKRLGILPEWIADVIWIETGKTFDPSIKNPSSSASGLIQFMDATARGLGTTTAELRAMSNVKQLSYVEKYFKNQISSVGIPKDFFDTYCLVFYPFWLNKPDTALMAKVPGNANISIDQYFGNKDGYVSKSEFRKFALSKLPKDGIFEIVTKKKP